MKLHQIIIDSTYDGISLWSLWNCQNASWTKWNWYQCSGYLFVFIIVSINDFIFQNNYWNLFKLLLTALMMASHYNNPEIVKMLLEQNGIDINAKSICLFLLLFFSVIRYFKIIIGIYSNYYGRRLWWHLVIVTSRLSKCFLNKKELIKVQPKIFLQFNFLETYFLRRPLQSKKNASFSKKIVYPIFEKRQNIDFF